jgi:hypothetical protein
LLQAALEGRRRVLGDEHHDTLTTLEHLAILCGMQGQLKEAEHLFREIVTISRRNLGDDHLSTLHSLHSLGNALRLQGRWIEAERSVWEVFDGMQRTLGDENGHTQDTRGFLQRIYAEGLQAHSGLEGLDRLEFQTKHARFLLRSGELANAQNVLRGVLDARVELLGDAHQDTLASLHALADVVARQGYATEAEDLFAECLEARQRELGTSHPDTLATLEALARLYASEERWPAAERDATELLERTPDDAPEREQREQLLEQIDARETDDPR